jgi:hypothetical protein
VIRDRILIDAGPIVALLAEEDAAHEACVNTSREYEPPFFTTWAVMAEAAWLLRHGSDSIPRLMGLVSQGLVVCLDLDANAGPAIAELAFTYADLRPDLADLTLVYLAGRDDFQTVFSLDRRDFTVYRDRRGQAFKLIP